MSLIEQSLEANRAFGEQYGVKFVLKDRLPDVLVRIDGDRVMQVMTNLLSNAAKFSPPHSEALVAVTHMGDAVRVSVIDRGKGIPKEFESRIFEKFAQADSSTTREKGGTGLGLSICKAIIEKHGGKIGFTSHIGLGSTFFFDLPIYHSKESPITISGIPGHD